MKKTKIKKSPLAQFYFKLWDSSFKSHPRIVFDTFMAKTSEEFQNRKMPGNCKHHILTFSEVSSRYRNEKVGEIIEWPEDIVLLRHPGNPFRALTNDFSKPINSYELCFSGGKPLGLDQLEGAKRGYTCFKDTQGRLRKLLKQIQQIVPEEGMDQVFLGQKMLFEILVLIQRRSPMEEFGWYELKSSANHSAKSYFVRQIEEVVCSQIEKNWTTTSLSRKLNISVSTLSHRFAKETGGQSVMAHVRKMKMEYARNLLINGQKVKVVSDFLGFSSSPHFSRSFKEHFGMSPKQFQMEVEKAL